jgi:hypothetical protein
MGIFGIITETEGFVVMPETIGKSRLSKMHPGQLLTAGAAPFLKNLAFLLTRNHIQSQMWYL